MGEFQLAVVAKQSVSALFKFEKAERVDFVAADWHLVGASEIERER